MKINSYKTLKPASLYYYCAGVLFLSVLTGFISIAETAVGSLPAAPHRYRIEIDVDYHNATFKGVETVTFTNTSREDLENIYFHLYPNFGLSEEDEPLLSVEQVRAESRDLKFSLRQRNIVLKIDLSNKLPAGKSIELTIKFAGRVPRVQREETSLLAHFLQEVNDAVNEDHQLRDARDIYFVGEEAMLLGYFYPIVAVRPTQSSDGSLAGGVGGIVFSDVADYEVSVKSDTGMTVIASTPGVEAKLTTKSGSKSNERSVYVFKGERLRGFGIVLAERVKSVEQKVGAVKVVSYFRDGDERLGKRALVIAASAVEAYSKAFGDYPYPLLQVIEMPMPAGYSGIGFPSLVTLAQAYYIDFDAPQSVRLPGVLREQADLIKSSFEFMLAHSIAYQWWGGIVGSDPERSPYVEESLAAYAAAYYHEVAHGKQLGDLVIAQQLKGAYQAYRMLGGVDQEVDKQAKEFKSALQYTAIVQAKGALLFVELRKELGDEIFFTALQYYFATHRFRIATADHLRDTFLAGSDDSRATRALFHRWLKEKHGDEDIGSPELALNSPSVSKIRVLGRVFVRIGRTAARPF